MNRTTPRVSCQLCWAFLVVGLLAPSAAPAGAAEVLFPQLRSTYHVAEAIEIAVVGLANGETAELVLKTAVESEQPYKISLSGEGTTKVLRIPPFSLAPGEYQILLAGQPQQAKLVVGRGLPSSTMFVSQSGGAQKSGGNFQLTNAFSFGLLTPQGLPSPNPRQLSGTMAGKDKLFAENLPDLIYMYYTGYVLHKPWGVAKEWCSPDMTENMRLFNFHVAQQMRRFDHNILMIGCIDEPGLPWGRTPAGGSATGFPGWNTAEWYESRGWKYTDDPAAGSDAEWLKYAEIRSAMLGDQTRQASDDIKQIWPTVTFSSDLYAPQAPMDGTDPWNQRANDVPSTHVFADYGIGKLGVLGGLYLEKAHDPLSKVAHAMNGQLFGAHVPQPQTRYAYHLMTNVLLAAGLRSNWWLNYGGMTPTDLIAVNAPAERLGPLFMELNSTQHEVALLWSVREMAMRCKEVTAREAHKKTGEQIKLMIPDLPAEAQTDQGKIDISAYAVGGNYRGEILTAHTALVRAGYPAHIVHERLLPQGVLSRYKVLVVVGQTFELPAEAQKAIADFVAAGGKVIVDPATKIKIEGAIKAEIDIANQGYKWTSVFGLDGDKTQPAEKAKENSYYQTNHYMESFSRAAVGGMAAALKQTPAQRVMETDSLDLACERHVGGEGQLLMIINAHDKLPEIPNTQKYFIWNYAPLETTYRLPAVPAGSVVYQIAGLDWQKVSKLADPASPLKESFEPGEMKLYLVASRAPQGLKLAAKYAAGQLNLHASLEGLKMPWPLTVSVSDPAGKELFHIYRATNVDGQWVETLPLGASMAPGAYTVSVTSPVADLKVEQKVDVVLAIAMPETIAETVRVFDEAAIKKFLAGKPKLTIAVGKAEQQAAAEKLAGELKAAGVDVTVKDERHIWRKALYPRVWDPYVGVHQPAKMDSPIPAGAKVTVQATIESLTYDEPVVKNSAGEPMTGDWRQPGTLLTVGPQGFISTEGAEAFFAEGCKLLVTEQKGLMVINGTPQETKTTPEFRLKWSRPWSKVTQHVGGFNLVPELPEAYAVDEHLILLGDSSQGELVRALQASELLLQVVDEKYPGPGKSLLAFAWSPFALEKNVILVGASDAAGLAAGAAELVKLAKPHQSSRP